MAKRKEGSRCWTATFTLLRRHGTSLPRMRRAALSSWVMIHTYLGQNSMPYYIHSNNHRKTNQFQSTWSVTINTAFKICDLQKIMAHKRKSHTQCISSYHACLYDNRSARMCCGRVLLLLKYHFCNLLLSARVLTGRSRAVSACHRIETESNSVSHLVQRRA